MLGTSPSEKLKEKMEETPDVDGGKHQATFSTENLMRPVQKFPWVRQVLNYVSGN